MPIRPMRRCWRGCAAGRRRDAVTLAPAQRAQAIAAYLVISIVWGTTFLGISYALRGGLPPFACAALRFLSSGLAVWAWLRLRGPRPFAGLPAVRVATSGVLLFAGGNGFTVWAQQGVPSGLTALLIASAPVAVMFVNWIAFERRRPAAWALIGTLIGLAGIGLTLSHLHFEAGGTRPVHLLSLLVATLSWAVGSMMVRGHVAAQQTVAAVCLQMLAGGAALAAMALLAGDWSRLQWAAVSPLAWWAVAYLALFGSVIAMTCYVWLLGHVAPQKVATYALVNPVVALALGAWLLGEPLSGTVFVAMALVLAGIALVLMQGRSRPREARRFS
jgi:drug/metabolite transporter (DMT)-like permease